jgi:hypothetical protein
MHYAYIDFKEPGGVPERLVNGGLYTGAPATGPWKNVPIVPEAHIFSQQVLHAEGAQGTPNSHKMAISTERPGNNSVQLPYYIPYSDTTNPQLKCLGPS